MEGHLITTNCQLCNANNCAEAILVLPKWMAEGLAQAAPSFEHSVDALMSSPCNGSCPGILDGDMLLGNAAMPVAVAIVSLNHLSRLKHIRKT